MNCKMIESPTPLLLQHRHTLYLLLLHCNSSSMLFDLNVSFVLSMLTDGAS